MPPLPPEQDAYGQILAAVAAGRDAQEIMEREDGLIYAGDPRDYLAPFRRWPATERRSLRWVRGRVLDVGCAAGRVALHLQERGHAVVAIDESPLAVEVARGRGVRDARVLSLADAAPGVLGGPFDTVVVMRNNLGLGGDLDAAPQVLAHLAALAAPGGRLLTDSVHPGRLDPVSRGTGRDRYRVRWRQYASPWFCYLMLAPEQVEAVVAGSPWRVRALVDDGATPRYCIVLELRG